MPWFEGTHTDTFTVSNPLETTRHHFSDLSTIVAHTEGLASHEIDGNTIHFVLALQDHGVVKFQGDYRCTYVLEGDTLRWHSAGGNTDQSGEITFCAVDDGTEVSYSETVKVDLDLAAPMAMMLKPVMGPMLAHEIKGFVKRMTTSLKSQAPS